MPSKFSVTGLDFDNIFQARTDSAPTVAFGYKVGGLDISGRYQLSAGGGSSDPDQIPFNTNYKYNNIDLRYFFKSGFVSINITTQPVNDTVLETETGEFSIVATGTGTLYYQWQKYNEGTANWDNLTNSAGEIAGATSATLQILNADYPTDEGSYRCVVTDNNGSLNSSSATLTVNYLPVITTEPVSNIYNDDNAVSYEVVATEGKPAGLTYKWQRLTTNVGAVWTDLSAGSETDIGISYTTANLTFRCQLARADYQYRCIVSNSAGSDTSNAAILYINPKFNTDGNLSTTKSVTVGSGENTTIASFSVNVGGSAVLSYQWYKKLDGESTFSEIGGDFSTFNDTVDETSNNAQYKCEISSSNGNTTLVSNICTLTVSLTPISITSFLGNGVANPELNAGQSLSYVVTAAGAGTLNYDFYKRVYTSRPSSYTDTSVQSGSSNTYTHNVLASEDDYDYFCAVSSSKASLGTENTSLSTLRVNYAPIINTQPVSTIYNDTNSVSYSVVAIGRPSTLTYKWQRLTTDSGAVWTDLSTGSETDIGVSYLTANLTFKCQLARADYQYRCIVSNSVGSTTSDPAILYINPKITTDLDLTKTVTVLSGQETTVAAFTIVAGGSATLSYQWYKDGSPIGANNPTFADTVDENSNGSQYYCVVSSSVSGTISDTSVNCTLTVNLTAISISSFLGNGVANPTVNEGSSLSYVVAATGSGTLNYNFYRDDVSVQSSTSNTYTHNVSLSEHGSEFYCAVSSTKASLGTVNTSISTLTVNYIDISQVVVDEDGVQTAVTSNEQVFDVDVGDVVKLIISAAGRPGVNYLWKKWNGSAYVTFSGGHISGQTTSQLQFNTILESDETYYACYVDNGAGLTTNTEGTREVYLNVLPVTTTTTTTTPTPTTPAPTTPAPTTPTPTTPTPTTPTPTTPTPTTTTTTPAPTTPTPTTPTPTTPTPTTATPTTPTPTTAEPTTAEPTTAEPTTAEPTTAEPTTAEPTTAEPTTAEPTTAEPTTAEPTTAEPTTAEPTTGDPTTEQP